MILFRYFYIYFRKSWISSWSSKYLFFC